MDPSLPLTLRDRVVAPAEFPVVMGILNVTPDSFSDGGFNFNVEAAYRHALRMIDAGAEIIDVGPESTRPGARSIDPEEQVRRAIPVIERIRNRNTWTTISIDTRSAAVARAAIAVGADWINDTAALRDDPDMVRVAAERGASIVLMHRRGTPLDMQQGGGPQYDDLIQEIADFLAERAAFAFSHGVRRDGILIDPGIGFGKRVEHNVAILKHLNRFVQIGYPVLIGASRKGFIGEITEEPAPAARLGGSVACAVLASFAGAAVVRAHDVGATLQAIRVARAVVRDKT
jgi:dihydropteroate synthase